MVRPVRRKWPITLRWGVKRRSYLAGYHTGTDFGVPTGTRVGSPGKGVVVFSGYDPKFYGNYIKIREDSGKREWLLAHLSKRYVRSGVKVKRGQLIGLSGATGNVTGPHVHAEERHYPYGYYDTHRPTAWTNG